MINIKNHTVEELKGYYQSIKKDGINPNTELFAQVPDMDLCIKRNGKFVTEADDVQKMLLWVICKSNIKG